MAQHGGGDRIVKGSQEHTAGLQLLKALRLYREAVREAGLGNTASRLALHRLRIAEAAYDSLPVDDRQIRDCMDDAISVERAEA